MLANEEYRGLVEYWATRSEKYEEIAAARAALTSWGSANDGMVKFAEGREPEKRGFFKRLLG